MPLRNTILQVRKFASGGKVPGRGNKDTVPALLTPGEFVFNREAARSIGAAKLHHMNKTGRVQMLNKGGPVEGAASLLAKLTPEQAALYAKHMGAIDKAIGRVASGVDPSGELYDAGSRSPWPKPWLRTRAPPATSNRLLTSAGPSSLVLATSPSGKMRASAESKTPGSSSTIPPPLLNWRLRLKRLLALVKREQEELAAAKRVLGLAA